MPATIKLFSDAPRCSEFRARVLSASKRDNEEFDVVLDRTAFYPESGGQLCDYGTLGGVAVTSVREDGDVIVHRVADCSLSGEVDGRIDWVRRFDHMQQHTGQHVLSRAFFNTAALTTVSFHMGDAISTIDLMGGVVDEDAVRAAEDLVNRVIEESRKIVVRTVPTKSLRDKSLRGKVPDGVSQARLVEVEGFDIVPCCGTHVASTAELRAIKVLKWEKVRNASRVYFKVGRRALDDYAFKHSVVQQLANQLTTSVDSLVSGFEKTVADAKAGRRALKRLSSRLAVLEKDALLADAVAVGSIRLIACMLPDADGAYLAALSGELRGVGGLVSLLGSGDGTVVCVAADDVAIDLATVAGKIASDMNGRGGGKGRYARASLSDAVQAKHFIEAMKDDVEKQMQ